MPAMLFKCQGVRHLGHQARAEVKPDFPGCTYFLNRLAWDNVTSSFGYLLPASAQDSKGSRAAHVE